MVESRVGGGGGWISRVVRDWALDSFGGSQCRGDGCGGEAASLVWANLESEREDRYAIGSLCQDLYLGADLLSDIQSLEAALERDRKIVTTQDLWGKIGER